MNEGVRRERGLWTPQGRAQLEGLSLPGWTNRPRQELLQLLDRFDPSFDQKLSVDPRSNDAGSPVASKGPVRRCFLQNSTRRVPSLKFAVHFLSIHSTLH